MKFFIEQFFIILAVLGLLCAIVFAAKSFFADLRRKRHGFRVRHGKLFTIAMTFAIIAILLAVIPSASAQATNGVIIAVTNQPSIVTTTATSNIVSWVKIQSDGGIATSWRFNQGGASTSNATLNVYSVVHGTNTVSTVPFAQLTAASTGASDVIVNTNWDRNELQGYEYLVIGSIANTTAITTLTNKGITIRRTPN